MSNTELTHRTGQDLDDDAAASSSIIAAAFSRDAENPAICVVDGWGLGLRVDRGHLEVADGVGRHRRVRRFAKATHRLSRLVVIGSSGQLSLDALRWCAGAGIAVVVLDPSDGSVLATSGSCAVDDGRIRRAQALALGTVVGLDIARYLISTKLHGQADIASTYLEGREYASTIRQLAGDLAATGSLEEVRQLEAAAANLYWKSWESARLSFIKKDDGKVPAHWRHFGGRRSELTPGTARNATDPANALFNYSYRLVEAEARLAVLSLGLDPGLGVLHADMRNRDGFVLDLMETCRPIADRFVARLIAEHTFRRHDFAEDARGVVRILPPLSHRLAEAMPSFGAGMAPVVEHVSTLLANASPYDVSVPTVLSGAKHRQAARARVRQYATDEAPPNRGPNPGNLPPRGRRRSKPSSSPPLPLPACRGCGGHLAVDADRTRPRGDWCPECLVSWRREIGASLTARSRESAQRFVEMSGTLPTHTPAARVARSEAMARQRAEQRKWTTNGSGEQSDLSWYEETVQPLLVTFSLPAIAKAAGVSTSAASKWRAGRAVPHRRHWQTLADLVGVT